VTETKKKKSEDAKAQKADLPLAQLILDCSKDKYRLVNAALRWAHEVKQREDTQGTTQDIINKALKEILAGQADLEDIEKLPPIPKSERPAPEPPKPLIIEKTEGEEKETAKSKNGAEEE
jgi:DNA-directed RNA polymerase subunit K/omega